MLHPTKKENGEIDDVSCGDAFLHFVAIGWKVLFSLVPPPHYLHGWATFFIAIIFIGLVTAIVGEVATLMGCVMGLKPGLTFPQVGRDGTKFCPKSHGQSASNVVVADIAGKPPR